MIGQQLGPYEITARLGVGGMGEVWRATDTKLKREVAIKVLPAEFVADRERLARFEREAQLLAQLNHPNIAQIYGLEASAGSHALVMELVEGPTLAERLEEGALPLDESLSFARQIAEALEEAHEKGIVHRDLKPQNIKASIEGKVKVLDFGLAKAMDPTGAASGAGSASQLAASPTLTLGATVQGVILGTAAYMAPEQARGGVADRRADIWAFGVVLYEMLTGASMFASDTVSDTLAAVLRAEIDLERLPADVPPAIRRLLRRCLERKPKDRLHAIADARLVIDDVLAGRADEVVVVAPAVAAQPVVSSWRIRLPWLVVGAVVGAVVALGLVAARGRGAASPAAGGSLTSVRPLVSGGEPYGPAISRDGRTLAFTAVRNGENRVWIKDLASGSESVLARNPSGFPSFSPDGTSLLFASAEGGRRSLYRIALATREERLVARDTGTGSWSPGGESVAFVRTIAEDRARSGSRQELIVVELGSGAERSVGRFQAEGRYLDSAPRWSPDGRRLAALARSGMSGVADQIAVFDVADGRLEAYEPRLEGLDVINLEGVDWASNDRLVLLVGDGPRGTTTSGRLARFDLGTRRTTSLLPLPALAGDVAYAGKGSVVLTLGSRDTNLFVAQRETKGAWSSLAPLTEGPYVDRQPAFSPDGSSIVFVSDRSGNYDVWRLTPATGELRRLTDHEAVDWDPAFSPDGTRLAFSSNRSGRFEIWIAEADGSAPRQVTDFENAQNPTWTGDGDWLVFARSDAPGEEIGLWRIRSDGTEASRISEHGSVAETSPDGRYTFTLAEGHYQIVRLEDGSLIPTRDLRIGRPRWSVEQGATYLWGLGVEGVRRFLFDPASGSVDAGETVVPRPPDAELNTLGVARDGSAVAVSYATYRSQIVRVDGLAALEER